MKGMLIVLKSDPAHACVRACVRVWVMLQGVGGVVEVRQGQMPYTAEDHA